ncbi:MAG: signal peptidase II [Planctomycetota bacterium]|nr:MAG: signal peptidase II [Planctomycetota bacterium]
MGPGKYSPLGTPPEGIMLSTMDNTPIPVTGKVGWARPWLFATVCSVVLALDLLSKWWIFRHPQEIGPDHPAWLWSRQDHWQEVEWVFPQINPGAAWSIGANTPWLIVALTVVLVPAIIAYYFWQIRGIQRPWEHLGFAAIIGGALGNAWDRFASAIAGDHAYGGVRDFIHVDLNWIGIPYVWPTFNIADSGISVGLVVVIIASFFNIPAASPRHLNGDDDLGVAGSKDPS